VCVLVKAYQIKI